MSDHDSSEFGFSVDGPLESTERLAHSKKLAAQRISQANASLLAKKRLKKELKTLVTDFRNDRRSRDLELFRIGKSKLENYFLQALANPELSKAERASLSLRKRVLNHLLHSQDRLISEIRFSIDKQKRQEADYDEVAPPLIGPLQGLVREIDSDRFNIHNQVEVETFYGHILATVSGHDELQYHLHEAKKRSLQDQLNGYEANPAVVFQILGEHEPNFRLALIQREMAESLKSAYGEISDNVHVKSLIASYPSYSRNPEIKSDIASFEALDIEKTIWQKILSIFSSNTKESFLKQHQSEHPVSTDMTTLVELLIQIQKISSISKSELHKQIASKLFYDLAHQLGNPNNEVDLISSVNNYLSIVEQLSAMLSS